MTNTSNTTVRSSRWRALAIVLGLALSAAAAVHFTPPFPELTRASSGPVISPQGDGFESAGTFNPSAVKKDGKFVILYRAQDRKGTSSLGYGTSEDGIHFVRRTDPVMVAQAPYEKGGGVEDPRIVNIGSTYYMTYTGYNNVDGVAPDHKDAQLCMATSSDLVHWNRQGVIMPAYKGKWNIGWTKSGAIVQQKIHGKYWMYYLGEKAGKLLPMGVASSTDLLHWTDALDRPVLPPRPGQFDSQVVEPGPAPVMTSEGILLIYNGADDKNLYSTGWVLFDKNDPTKVLARADRPIFMPAPDWEKVGQVPNVVFVEGLVREKNRWLFYYGAADKYVGVASTPAF